jgi:hypothetical protein
LLPSVVLLYEILLSEKGSMLDARIEVVIAIILIDNIVLVLGEVAAVDRVAVLNRELDEVSRGQAP